MSFIARYPGQCCQCGERITPGEACRYWGDEDQAVGHVDCEVVMPGVTSDAPGRNERSCPSCFQIHAGECL